MYELLRLGVRVPAGFPGVEHDAAGELAQRLFERRNEAADAQTAFMSGWNSVAYRFLSCDEHGRRFTELLSKFGVGPSQPERYAQERDFFDFVVSGLACLEAYHYAVYALMSIDSSDAFPFRNARDRRRVTPDRTKEALGTAASQSPIARAVAALHSDHRYQEWATIRNVLAHRGLPGRLMEASTQGTSGGQYHPFEDVEGVRLDVNTTAVRQEWLAAHLRELVSAVATHLRGGLSFSDPAT